MWSFRLFSQFLPGQTWTIYPELTVVVGTDLVSCKTMHERLRESNLRCSLHCPFWDASKCVASTFTFFLISKLGNGIQGNPLNGSAVFFRQKFDQ